MRVAQPLLQAHDGLAVGGEAEVPRLNNAGVHRPDRNLMQRRTFRGKEGVCIAAGTGSLLLSERVQQSPAAVVEPAPRVGAAVGLQPVQVTDGTLQPH